MPGSFTEAVRVSFSSHTVLDLRGYLSSITDALYFDYSKIGLLSDERTIDIYIYISELCWGWGWAARFMQVSAHVASILSDNARVAQGFGLLFL